MDARQAIRRIYGRVDESSTPVGSLDSGTINTLVSIGKKFSIRVPNRIYLDDTDSLEDWEDALSGILVKVEDTDDEELPEKSKIVSLVSPCLDYVRASEVDLRDKEDKAYWDNQLGLRKKKKGMVDRLSSKVWEVLDDLGISTQDVSVHGDDSVYFEFESPTDETVRYKIRISDHYAPHGSGFDVNSGYHHDKPDLNIVYDTDSGSVSVEYDKSDIILGRISQNIKL